jgi:hypothetical protein
MQKENLSKIGSLNTTYMSERKTKEITTPAGHKIVLRTYLTGREANEIKAAMFSSLKMNMDDAQSGKVNVGDVSGAFLIEQERKALGFLLVSIDGGTNAPVDKLSICPQRNTKRSSKRSTKSKTLRRRRSEAGLASLLLKRRRRVGYTAHRHPLQRDELHV